LHGGLLLHRAALDAERFPLSLAVKLCYKRGSDRAYIRQRLNILERG
jgi:hypothetical protein